MSLFRTFCSFEKVRLTRQISALRRYISLLSIRLIHLFILFLSLIKWLKIEVERIAAAPFKRADNS